MIVICEESDNYQKIFIDKLLKEDIEELLQNLKQTFSYQISIINVQTIPLRLLKEFYKYKQNIEFCISEEKLKYYLLNMGFTVESLDKNNKKNENILSSIKYIAIGGSAGSLKKFIEIIKYLPSSSLTLFIVMHQKSENESHLSQILQRYTTHYKVIDAKNDLEIETSCIYIATPDKHLVVKNGKIILDDGALVNFSKPSISVTFSSLSKEYKNELLTFLVCGYGNDGSDSLAEVRKNGGLVFIEQLYECQATPMLENAINTKEFDKILSINDLSKMLFEKIKRENSIEDNLDLFLEEIFLKYGYDYRGYQKKHIKRRVEYFFNENNYDSFHSLKEDVLSKRRVFEELFLDLSINVTTFFRNPEVFKSLRKEIEKRFINNNIIKIWCAGCSTGEEPYSIAIMLKELGIYHKCLIYATDINDVILEEAKNGAFSNKSFEVFKEHYFKAEMGIDFDKYFEKNEDFVCIKKEIKDKILFFKHNLSLDNSPNEFQVIICRNVLIYFNRNLIMTVLKLSDNSLLNNGLLVLGESETLYKELGYKIVDENKKIYKKVSFDA